MSTEYDSFMKMDVDQHIGEWVAISNHKIIASGKDFKQVYKKAKALSKKQPFITRVPDKETMIF